MRSSHSLATLVLMLLVVASLSAGAFAQSSQPQAVTVPPAPVAEGNDYATRVLGRPWDLSSFDQLSYYFNESGQRRLVSNPTFSAGVLSGTSFNNAVTGDGNADFFPLFPGYIGESSSDPLVLPLNDLVGANYPIKRSSYNCLYVALRSESPAANALGPDVMRIFWFADRQLNRPGGAYGMTSFWLYQEALTNLPTHYWQVVKVNLATAPQEFPNGVPWTSRTQWEGLRIDPTAIAAGTNFAVDWVRLTDCGAVNRTITWNPDPSVTAIWVRPAGSNRDIRLVKGITGSAGSASVDLQGLEAGSYTVGLGTETTCCTQRSTQSITLNPTPSGSFVAPAPNRGVDYATQAGNAWDFRSDSDAEVIQFVSSPQVTSAVDDDGLLITTAPGPLPAGVDVAVLLNTPQPIDPNRYRYLTIDMETTWLVPWANIPDGMIGRWIWSIQGTSGRPGYRCTMVGPDIPYDVGRQRIMVDLFDPAATVAEEHQGECPGGALNWKTGEILDLRFDPNENVTGAADPITGGGNFVQRIRSIRLTQAESVAAGGTYMVSLSLSKPVSQVTTNFFYTTDPDQPTQHPVLVTPTHDLANVYRTFLPLAVKESYGVETPDIPNLVTFAWNTTGVPLGEYYICAEMDDGLNQDTVCSLVPIEVR
jgi:hypothetical protein